MKKDLILGQEYLAFLLLNLFDLFLTGWIFRHHGQEANVIALTILKNYGLQGFVIYKFIMVVFIVIVCELLAVKSLPKARILILSACFVYMLVVLYEAYLTVRFISIPASNAEHITYNAPSIPAPVFMSELC